MDGNPEGDSTLPSAAGTRVRVYNINVGRHDVMLMSYTSYSPPGLSSSMLDSPPSDPTSSDSSVGVLASRALRNAI